MVKKILISLLILSQFVLVNAQNDTLIQLTGIVVNDSLEPVPFSHIIITTKSQGTISNFYGFFSLAADKNDTILFSSMGYKPKLLTFSDSAFDNEYYVQIKLELDTIFITQINVFPWPRFEQFKQAFLTLDIPDDDIERARKNIELINIQKYSDVYIADAGLSYKTYMNNHYNKLYTRGQYPINNLLNPFAWASFFEAIKNGDFKKKEE